MRQRERNREDLKTIRTETDGFASGQNGDLQTRAVVPTYVSAEHRDMETQAERLRDTDTEFYFSLGVDTDAISYYV